MMKRFIYWVWLYIFTLSILIITHEAVAQNSIEQVYAKAKDLEKKFQYSQAASIYTLANKMPNLNTEQRVRILISWGDCSSNQNKKDSSLSLNVLLDELLDEITIPPNCQLLIEQLPTLNIDVLLIKQVFNNLINNAIKYSNRNQHPIVIQIKAFIKDDITIEVCDNGLGFDPSLSNNLFKPFHRLHSNIDGKGIGLVVIKTIIEKHGGKVFAHNNANTQGATFGFTLPLEALA